MIFWKIQRDSIEANASGLGTSDVFDVLNSIVLLDRGLGER